MCTFINIEQDCHMYYGNGKIQTKGDMLIRLRRNLEFVGTPRSRVVSRVDSEFTGLADPSNGSALDFSVG